MASAIPVTDAFDAEATRFRRLVQDIPDQDWELPTPAPGWSIRDQVAHVAFVFDLAARAASRPADFLETIKAVPPGPGGFDKAVNAALVPFGAGTPADVLQRWDAAREASSAALAAHDETPVPWLVNPLPAPILLCAGMIEMFGHGQDVADARGVAVERTDALAHHVGFVHRTRDFGYESHGLTPPDHAFRFEITLPSGAEVLLGPEDSPDAITGPAEDLCLLATRRRHHEDLRLHARGAEAVRYLSVAQAYRGPAGPGREPGAAAAYPAA